MNEHIEIFLNHYIDLAIAPEYAVLLTGEWGSGKTFFIKNFLESKKDDKKIINISLFGLTKLEEINEQIFQQLHPFLANKYVGIAGNLIKGAFKLGTSIDLNNDKKEDIFASMNIDKIDKNSLYSLDDKTKKKEFIFVFDDLERTKIHISEVLGYINTLVEKDGIKVLILADETKIDKIKIDEEKYKNFKEKVIGKTFQIAQNFDSAFDSFVNLVSDTKEVLETNKETIQDVYIAGNYRNLRHIRQTILDFDWFYKNIDTKFRKHPELMQNLVKVFFSFSIEIKQGNIDANKLEKKGYFHYKDDIQEKTPIMKYYLNSSNILLEYEQWGKLFSYGTLPQDEIANALQNSQYFAQEVEAEWIRLWHYRKLENTEFKQLLETMVGKFNRFEYQEHEVLQHVTGLLLRFSEAGLYPYSKDKVVEQAKEVIDACMDIWEVKQQYDIDAEHYGLGYCEEDSLEFQQIKNYMEEVNQKACLEGLVHVADELLKRVKEININGIIGIFEEMASQPLFAKMDVNQFFDAFIELKFDVMSHLLSRIENRYKFAGNRRGLQEELSFWQRFNALLSEEIEKQKGELSGYLLTILKTYTLEEKIIKVLEKED